VRGGAREAQPEAAAYLAMVWGALAFALMGALSHQAGLRCDWRLVAAARASVAFVCALALALTAGVRLVVLRPRVLWLRSLAGSLGLVCAFYALTHLPISTAVTLGNTFPVWVALLAWPLLGQRPTGGVWLAVVTGLAGVLLIQRPHWAASKLAVLAALGAALMTAVAMIGLNRLRGVDARAVVTHFSGVSTAVCLALLALSGGVSYAPLAEPRVGLLLGGVGLMGTLGQLGMTRAFALGAPAKVAVVGLTQIVFAFCLDLLLWGRRLDAATACGILLVVAPTAWLLLHSPLRRAQAIHTT
jgi:drug/metabolite transporter (DMT)-like permease